MEQSDAQTHKRSCCAGDGRFGKRLYARIARLTEIVLGVILASVLGRLIAAAHHVDKVHSIVHDQRVCMQRVTLCASMKGSHLHTRQSTHDL